MLQDSHKPVPKRDVDYTALKIMPTPEEFFLLSRIDGNLTVDQICQISGLSQADTHHAITRLHEAGLLDIPGFSGSASAPAAAPAAPAAPAAAPAASAPASEDEEEEEAELYTRFPTSLDAWRPPAGAMQTGSDLEEAQQREILFVHAHLEQISFYELLGVDESADRKEIRAMYFLLSKRFHPDRFYGKELGTLREPVEAVFGSVNKAYQTLSHKKRREEYDAERASAPAAPRQAPAAAAPVAAPSPAAPSPAAPAKPAAAPAAPAPADEPAGDPAAAREHIARAERHETSGEVVEAAQAYMQAFQANPDVNVALRAAGLLARLGHEHHSYALKLARAAARHDAQDTRPLIFIGDLLEEQDRGEEALRYYQRAQELDPSNRSIGRRIEYLKNLIL